MVSHGNGQTRVAKASAVRKSLESKTRKELAQLARQQRIPGWHPMRKQELVDALVLAASRNNSPRRNSRRKPTKPVPRNILGLPGDSADLLIAEAVSPLWISARWNVSSCMMTRADAALGSNQHKATPVLRLYKLVEQDRGPATESRLRDTPVQLDTGEACLQVDHAAHTYRLQLGFAVSTTGAFFVMSHSDPVTTPRKFQANGNAAAAGPTRPSRHDQHASNAANRDGPAELPLEVHTDLVIYGRTTPDTVIEFESSSVEVGRDGQFELRLPLENGRQFVPATATAPDLSIQRSLALSVERHLKLLDPETSSQESHYLAPERH